jgi:uncharacterized protein YdaU (DUF1376 family)
LDADGVNYYEHHLGDYAAATGHLSWDEDMAYTRLLRAYYHHERAIPAGQAYRLARATTPAQRKAVDVVLGEFFVLVDGAHGQKRADAEIARYQDKQRKAKASADARWSQSERNANASPNAMRTHSEGNAPSLQTPDPYTSEAIASAADGVKPNGKVTDPSEIIFGYGVPMLTVSGSTDKHARSFLAGLRKEHGDAVLIKLNPTYLEIARRRIASDAPLFANVEVAA